MVKAIFNFPAEENKIINLTKVRENFSNREQAILHIIKIFAQQNKLK